MNMELPPQPSVTTLTHAVPPSEPNVFTPQRSARRRLRAFNVVDRHLEAA